MARQKRPLDAVQFTRESSERIARVVRAAETSLPAGPPLSFAPFVDGRRPRQVRAATFSGSWPIGSSKAVTFKNVPAVTASVVNLSWPITLTAYSSEDCLVGKDGTAWYLVVPRLEAATAAVYQTQQRTYVSDGGLNEVVVGVSLAATLNTNNCAITIGQTLTTASIRVVTQTQTALFVTSSVTSSYLRMRVP